MISRTKIILAAAILLAVVNWQYVSAGQNRAPIDSESMASEKSLAGKANGGIKLLTNGERVTKEQLVVEYDSVPVPVDLGLSVRWAPYNLGAANPNQIGGYYTVDNKNIEKLWGNGWRLPTRAELDELVSKCTVERVGVVTIGDTSTGDAVMLYKITGPNGNSIRVIGTYYLEPESADGYKPLTYTTAIIPSSTPKPSPFNSQKEIFAVTINRDYEGDYKAKIGTYNSVYHSGELQRLFALRPVRVHRDPPPPPPIPEHKPDIPKPKPDLTPVSIPNPDRATWKKIAQLFLDRKTSYHELRRGIHFTNEPDKDSRAKYRYTGLNMSMAEYNEWAKHGIVFKTVNPAEVFKSNTMVERTRKLDEAAKGSSYPAAGTYCGQIVSIADIFKSDMYTGKGTLNCDVYFFAMEHYMVKNILEIEEGRTNGVDLVFVVMEVEEQPTPYKIAYNKVIYEANKYLGGRTNPPVIQNKTMQIVFGFSFDKTKKAWQLRLAAKINPNTGKAEEWPIQ